MYGLGEKLECKCKRGQSLVEFALILPLLALLIVGIFDLGRAFFATITITNSARSGARYYTIHSIEPDVTQITCDTTVNEASLSGTTITYDDVTVSCGVPVSCLPSGTPAAGCAHHQSVIVTINYLYDDMLFKFFFPTGIAMHRNIEMFIP